MATNHTHKITISRGDYFAGKGFCTPEDGDIECSADLGNEVYALIEQALIDGEFSVDVDGEIYEWELELVEVEK